MPLFPALQAVTPDVNLSLIMPELIVGLAAVVVMVIGAAVIWVKGPPEAAASFNCSTAGWAKFVVRVTLMVLLAEDWSVKAGCRR